MAQYDGSIRINTQINTKNASSQMMALENRMVKTADKIAELRSKMDALKNIQIPTTEYKSIESDISKANQELAKLIEKQAQMQNEGKDSGTAWETLNMRIQASKDYIAEAQAEMQRLVAEGKAFVPGGETEEYTRLSQQLQYAQNDMAILNQRHKELEERQGQNRDGYKRLGKAARDGAKTASKAVKGMNDALKSGFKNILKYGLGIRSVYALVNKIRTGIKEGFSNLYNDKNMTAFKESVDGLKASLLTLKNAFAAAFRPLVEAAIPYLQKAIEYMTRFLDVVGQIFAAIRGQSVYTKAIKQTTAAIKDQNKAQNKQLSSLDKLNNLTSQSGGGADDGGVGTMFEEAPVDTRILDFLQKIKDLLKPVIEYTQKLKDIFIQGFWDGLGDWQYRWESIKASISSIKDSLIDIWTDPAVLSAGDRWAQSVAYLLGSIAGSMTSIGLTIATNLIGGMAKYLEQNKERIKGYLVSMFDIWAEINQKFSELFQSISYVFEAFASEQGQQLTANIIGIFEDALMGASEFLSKLMRDVLNIFIQPFVDNKEEFRTALEGFLSVLSEVTGTIKEGIDETFDKLNEVYDEHFKPFFDSISNGLSDTVGKFLEMWNTHIQPILDRWAEKFDILWSEHIQPMLNNFMELLGSLADLFTWLWEEVLKPQLDWFITVFGPTIGDIFDFVVSVIDTAVTLISDMINGIVQIVKGVIDILVGLVHGDWQKVWDGFTSVIEGVETTTKGIINSIIGVVETLANGVVAAVNTMIRAINSISVDIPDSVPSWLGGGTTIGFNLPEIPNVSIPRLATGTVVPPNREFMAVLGDNKQEPEIVSPISTMKQAFKEAMSEMGGGFGNGKIELRVIANVEGRTLFEITQDYAMDYFNRTGRSPYPM